MTQTNSTLWDRFTQVVTARPDHVAVRDRARTWTYAELHARAEAIAAHLDDGDASDRVACLLSHGGEMIAGVLGVLAGGRAYVPLDPTHPIDRSAFVLADSGARTLLCDPGTAAFAARLGGDVRVLRIDEAVTARPPRRRPRPDDLAYCLYTSGSTGRPKGVVQRHAHVVHLLDAYGRRLELVPDDVITLLSTFAFDAAVVDLFSTLLTGATLCVYELRARGLVELAATLAEHRVTIYHSTPTVWRALVDLAPSLSPTIRTVVLGGEEVVADDVARLRQACAPSAVLVNGYGMTECSWALLHVVRPGDVLDRRTVPLGTPIDGVRVTLKTAFGVQRTVNGVGTICIESPYVAVGYHARPEETATAFPAPHTYLTSDLGRLLPGGQIEFAGRHAHLVKLRGFRIDLRELEAALAVHPDVHEAAVAVHDGPRGPELVAYIVAHDGTSAAVPAIREHLVARLPDYMVPAVIMPLAALPLGPTGKLDRNALPAPERQSAAPFVAPRNATEETIATIWQQLLRVERVGVDDDFFALGGHSLLAMRFVSELAHAVGVQLPVRHVFEGPTVAQLARVLPTAGRATGEAPIAIVSTTARRAPLIAPQRGTFEVDRDAPRNRMNRIMWSYWVDGPPHLDALERALRALRTRHSILRARFYLADGVYWQELLDEDALGPPLLERIDLSTLAPEDREEAVRKHVDELGEVPFDLANGQALRAQVLVVSPVRHRVTLSVHRIVADASSQAIDRDLVAMWRALAAAPDRDPQASLPPVERQFFDLADYLARREVSPFGADDRAYWHRVLADAPELVIPSTHARGPIETRRQERGGIATFAAARVTEPFSRQLLQSFQRLSQATRTSASSALMTPLLTHLARVTGQPELVFVTYLNFRHLPGFEHTPGLFANPLVIRVGAAGDASASELVSRTHAAVTEAFDHGECDVLALVPPRALRLCVNYVYAPAAAPTSNAASAPSLTPVVVKSGRAQRIVYDLMLFLTDSGEQLDVALLYNSELFSEEDARGLLRGYVAQAEALARAT